MLQPWPKHTFKAPALIYGQLLLGVLLAVFGLCAMLVMTAGPSSVRFNAVAHELAVRFGTAHPRQSADPLKIAARINEAAAAQVLAFTRNDLPQGDYQFTWHGNTSHVDLLPNHVVDLAHQQVRPTQVDLFNDLAGFLNNPPVGLSARLRLMVSGPGQSGEKAATAQTATQKAAMAATVFIKALMEHGVPASKIQATVAQTDQTHMAFELTTRIVDLGQAARAYGFPVPKMAGGQARD